MSKKRTPKGRPSLQREAKPDDPIYQKGIFVGQTRKEEQSSSEEAPNLDALEENIISGIDSKELIKSYWMTRFVENSGVDIYDELASESVEMEADSIWDADYEEMSVDELMKSNDPLMVESVEWWKLNYFQE